jgi:DNA-binding transcriptional LysR family regulator
MSESNSRGFDRQASFRRFSNYVVALQAAEENQGIVLGWHSHVRALFDRGKLVRIGEMEIDAPVSYYLTWAENRPLSAAAHCCATGYSRKASTRSKLLTRSNSDWTQASTPPD